MLSDAAALISMTAISSSGTSVSVRMAEDDMDWARSDSTTSRRTIRAKRGVRPGKPGSGPRFLKDGYRFCYDLGHFLRRHFLRILVAFLRIQCAFSAHFMHFRSSRPNAVDAQAC